MSGELIATCALLLLEIVALAIVYSQSRKPPDLKKVRIMPYAAISVFLTLLVFLTAAHLISLLTGTQVQPRKPKGMR
jgi:hypothetical protein